MNTQERDQLTRFLQELVQAQAGVKDVEAERLIRENCNYQPDASYLLVQRVLLLEQALKKVQDENARLRQSIVAAPGSSGNFLNDNAWGHSPQAPSRPAPLAGAAAAPLPAAAALPAAGSSMLGTIASTAAGVVAGSFLFQGIEHLMGNTHGSRLIGSDDYSSANEPASEGFGSFGGADEGGDGFASLIPDDSDLDSII